MSFKSTLTRFVSRAGTTLAKNYPTIALTAGVVGFAGTVGLAIHATNKSQWIIGNHKSDIHHTRERFKKQNDPYSPEQFKKDQIAIWTNTITLLGKNYAPTMALGVASIAALISGQSVLSNRLNTMTIAYEGARTLLKTYRENVKKEVGEDKELELYTTSVADGRERLIETGVLDPDCPGYEFEGTTFWFDSSTSPLNYQDSDMMNANFLRDVENAMNRRLQQRGHLFLNDVYEALGMEDTPLGTQIGWINIPGKIESYVDFGFDNKINETVMGRIKEASPDKHAYLLDLNVDGVIWNMI